MMAMRADKIDTGIGKVSAYAFVFIAGWLACSGYYGTLHLTKSEQTLQHVQTNVIPKLTAAAHCEGKRADVATVVAKKAIRGALVDTAPVPSPQEIPQDTCPHLTGK